MFCHSLNRQRRGKLLRLEILEARCMLASVPVSTLNDIRDGDVTGIAELLATPGDDGEISLREAIEAANAEPLPDTITFDWASIGPARDLHLSDLGQITITEAVTIDAAFGRPDLLTDPDNMITIHAFDPNVNFQGDAISLAA